MTRVLFFDIPATKDFNGEILAYFPDLKADFNGNYTSYAHIGQHSACSPDFVANKKLASPHQYKDLLKELVNQGYEDLHVLNTDETEYHRKPTALENKLGYGATHYCTFTRWQVQKGLDWPKWLKGSADGLRYYY